MIGHYEAMKRKTRVRPKKCVSCGEEMHFIYSYSVREICSPCGGKAKLVEANEQEEKKARKSKHS